MRSVNICLKRFEVKLTSRSDCNSFRHTKMSKETNKAFNNSLGMYTSNLDGLRVSHSDIHDGKEVLIPR